MSGLQKRLEKLEEIVNPSDRIVMVFVRPGNKEDDCAKQTEEYFARWGCSRDPIFLLVTEYCEFDQDSETFIQKMRARRPTANCYTDWWDKEEYPST